VINRPRPGLFEVAFAIRGSILPRIKGHLAFMLCVAAIAVLVAKRWPGLFGQLNAMPFTLVGLSLSIFMSFRNNACYQRWWEGRQLWGQLVIACRSFTREVARLEENERTPLLLGLCGFSCGLAALLRDKDQCEAIEQWVPRYDWSKAPNPTDAVLREVGAACLDLMERERIRPIHYGVLEAQLTTLSSAQAGCERIKRTPLPFGYSLLLHRTAHIYCLLLPFALASSLGWWTILLTLIIAYTFFGLDALSDEIGDPFGDDPNDLPLAAIVRGVERELLAATGSATLPPPIVARNYVLS
jgi:putative membrane protein